MPGISAARASATSVAIGGLPIGIVCERPDFIRMLEQRYAGFIEHPNTANAARGADSIEFEVEITPPNDADDSSDQELSVRRDAGRWLFTRGDFRAEWDPASKRGRVRQPAFPYAIDSVMRIVHSLVLADHGGFLVHSASAVRAGRAFLFSGVSGAGKTTIARLAPPDVTILTDEISYVRPLGDGYQAFGTPFAGDLGKPGANISAPVAGLYLLVQGRHNHADRISPSDAARRLLRNILFFAHDDGLVEQLFRAACEFVLRVPVYELSFRPDCEVWNLIR